MLFLRFNIAAEVCRDKTFFVYIHCLVSLPMCPYSPPKRVLHTVRPCASYFKFHYVFFFLRPSISCLRLFLVFPSLLSFLLTPSIGGLRSQLLHIYDHSLRSIVCLIFISYLIIRNISSFFLNDQNQLIFSIVLQHYILNFPIIYNLISAMSKFQGHTKLCSKCSTLLVSFLN